MVMAMHSCLFHSMNEKSIDETEANLEPDQPSQEAIHPPVTREALAKFALRSTRHGSIRVPATEIDKSKPQGARAGPVRTRPPHQIKSVFPSWQSGSLLLIQLINVADETDSVPGVDLQEPPATVKSELDRLLADVVLSKRKAGL